MNVFEPEYIVIGGGLSRAADLYLDARRGRGRLARALRRCGSGCTVSLARGGANAGVIGAGVLAAQECGDAILPRSAPTSSEGAE